MAEDKKLDFSAFDKAVSQSKPKGELDFSAFDNAVGGVKKKGSGIDSAPLPLESSKFAPVPGMGNYEKDNILQNNFISYIASKAVGAAIKAPVQINFAINDIMAGVSNMFTDKPITYTGNQYMSFIEGLDEKTSSMFVQGRNQDLKDVVSKINVLSTPKYEKELQARTEKGGIISAPFVIQSLGSLSESIGANAFTGGLGLYASIFEDAYSDGLKKGFTNNEALVYGSTIGSVNAYLERKGLDAILKKVPKPIQDKVSRYLAGKAMSTLVKSGVELTEDAIQDAIKKEVNSFSGKVLQAGAKGLYNVGTEGGTETLQELASYGTEELSNYLKGQKIFKNDEVAKRFLTAFAGGAIGGGSAGSITSLVGSDNTFNYINEEVSNKYNNIEKYNDFKTTLAEDLQKNNVPEQAIEKVMVEVDKMREKHLSIPSTVAEDKRQAVYNIISERDKVQNILNETDQTTVDPAFSRQANATKVNGEAAIATLNDLAEAVGSGKKTIYRQTENGYEKEVAGEIEPIDELMFNYAKLFKRKEIKIEGDKDFKYYEKDGKYFKKFGAEGKEQPITKATYDFETKKIIEEPKVDVLKDLEAQKAEIEKRRQEELETIPKDVVDLDAEFDINAKYNAELAALETPATAETSDSNIGSEAEQKVVADTKQQIKEFGVKKDMIDPVSNVIGNLFQGLKKAGLTAAKNVGEWVSIGKGEEKPYSLKINGNNVQVKNVPAEVVNGFYSPLEKIINESKQDKLPTKQWIEKYANSEEAEFTGLKDWLAQQEGSVSKADIQKFLKDNRINIVEVVREKWGKDREFGEWNKISIEFGRNGWVNRAGYKILEKPNGNLEVIYNSRDWEEDEFYIGSFTDINLAKEGAKKHHESMPKATAYSEYQLKGESNDYKEILVTLPPKGLPDGFEVKKVVFDNGDVVYRANGDGLSTPHKNYQDAENELKDRAKFLYGTGKLGGAKFKSTHFDEPNILVHLRMNTRTDSEGNKVLFLEEVQSDWGQKGKKKGFKRDVNKSEQQKINKIKEEQQKLLDGLKIYKLFKELTKGRLDDMSNSYDDDKNHTLISILSRQISQVVDNPYYDKNNQEDVERGTQRILKDFDNSLNYWFKEKEFKISDEDKLRLIDAYNEDAKAGTYKKSENYSKYDELNALKKVTDLRVEAETIKFNATKGITPSAPFVTDTNEWTKLGLKIALKEAIAQGVDKISWTTGEQQFDRWGSEEISWNVVPGKGQWTLAINQQTSINNNSLKKSDILVGTKEELRDVILENLSEGRNETEIDKLTDRIWNKMQSEDSGSSLPRKEGMEAFYGNPDEGKLGIVGNVAKKLFKQEPNKINIVDEKTTQYSVDITPELRASVQDGQPLFKKSENQKEFGGFETRDGKPIGFNYDTEKVARERFDFSKLNQIGKGSDRTVYDLGDGKVLKVAHTARGLTQNIYEGDYYLKGVVPEVFERGLNYVVAEKVDSPARNNKEVYMAYIYDEFEKRGITIGESGGMLYIEDSETLEPTGFVSLPKKLQNLGKDYGYLIGDSEYKNRKINYKDVLKEIQQENTDKVRLDDMLDELKQFTQKDFDNKTGRLQEVLEKYELSDILSYDVLWGDFTAKRNWGIKDGNPIHLDGGTFGGVKMITSYRDKTNLSDPEFKKIYDESRKLKKEFGDTDDATMYKKDDGEIQAQYRIESGKNIVEAIKKFNGSPKAVVALTHEIMHPTVVAILDGAKEQNETGLKHANTIVTEYNKANPDNQITLEDMISANDAFKGGDTTDAYRSMQEFIAESWEKYHYEGKQGFSKAFQEVLDTITDAFRKVYKSLKGTELTPELKSLFDDLLSKSQQKEINVKFAKAADLFYAVNEAADRSSKREQAAERRQFLEENPSIKYIDDNLKSIMNQLADSKKLTKTEGCP